MNLNLGSWVDHCFPNVKLNKGLWVARCLKTVNSILRSWVNYCFSIVESTMHLWVAHRSKVVNMRTSGSRMTEPSASLILRSLSCLSLFPFLSFVPFVLFSFLPRSHLRLPGLAWPGLVA